MTSVLLPRSTPEVARVKQYMENVPGRKVVEDTNIAAEVMRKTSRILLSAPRFVLESACTKYPSLSAEASPNKHLTPKNTGNFGLPPARTPSLDKGRAKT